MSNSSFQLVGLDELRQALRNLPEEMADEARSIVTDQAEAAGAEIRGVYPEGKTGNLRAGLSVTPQAASRFGAVALVKSASRHAHLFEFGTTQRRSRFGNRGRMPKGPDSERMIPIAIRRRRTMTQLLIDLVRRAGFTVDTDA